MPSYRYLRDMQPEEQRPEPPPEYSQKDKAKNWWHYHWGWVAGGVALIALAVYFVASALLTVKPDYTLGIVAPYSLPDALVNQLSSQLTPYFSDKNGDGKTVVAVEVYTLAPMADELTVTEGAGGGEGASTGETAAPAGDPYAQMAGVTRLSAALSMPDNFIFLFSPDEAEAYQASFQLFGWPDGALAEENTPLTNISIAFKNCPALAVLDLHYSDFNNTIIDGQQILGDYCIGLRAIAGTAVEHKKGAPENWQEAQDIYSQLTQGATG